MAHTRFPPSRAVRGCSAAARRGYSPGDALAEFKAAIDVVVKKHANRDAYLLQTAEGGRCRCRSADADEEEVEPKKKMKKSPKRVVTSA